MQSLAPPASKRMTVSLPISSGRIEPGGLPRTVIPGLYVHVPFCFHKCHYCDFYSITRQTEPRMAAFVDRVLTEAALWSAGPSLVPHTVFFGGGTPSLLPLQEMLR